MNTLSLAVFFCLAFFAQAKPSGHGVVVAGPAGIVTGAGAYGIVGHGFHDDGQWHGEGLVESGAFDGHAGVWGGHAGLYAGHANTVIGNGATIVGPSAAGAVVSGHGLGVVGHGLGLGVVGHGLGLGLGHGLVGAGLGLGHGLVGAGHGVAVVGPHTVPAVVAGPSGSITASGLYGVGHGHGHW